MTSYIAISPQDLNLTEGLGRMIVSYYWICNDLGQVIIVFTDGHILPQCHYDLAEVNEIKERTFNDGYHIELIQSVFLPNNLIDIKLNDYWSG